jgi:eukaryotic-like serine/threonine-protein kinase
VVSSIKDDIRTYMKSRGLTQSEFAQAAGVSQSLVSRLISGRTLSLQPATRERILGVLGGMVLHPVPAYRDDRVMDLSAELQALLDQKRALRSQGVDISEVDQAILAVKRELRSGPSLEPGDILGERYLLVERVGAGGFGTVWKAWDQENLMVVAVKVLHGQWSSDRSRIARFVRGVEAMKRVAAPGIARILDGPAIDGGHHFYVMEYLPGGDLRTVVLRGERTRKENVESIVQVARALCHLHEQSMVHRDVRPSNIMLDERGGLQLVDFDIVRSADTTGGTRTGALGAFLYAPPEQMQAAGEVDERADVYSLGATLAFCLAEEDLSPGFWFTRETFLEELNCGESMREIVRKATEPDLGERTPNVAAFLKRLQAVLEDE